EDLGTSTEKPISIRDSLRAEIDSSDVNVSASGNADRQREEHGRFAPKEADKGTPAAAPVPKTVDVSAAANAATAVPQTPAVAPEQ
ncbi:hypothetical protein ACEQ6A_35150, partial [Rhizobium brockwellii]